MWNAVPMPVPWSAASPTTAGDDAGRAVGERRAGRSVSGRVSAAGSRDRKRMATWFCGEPDRRVVRRVGDVRAPCRSGCARTARWGGRRAPEVDLDPRRLPGLPLVDDEDRVARRRRPRRSCPSRRRRTRSRSTCSARACRGTGCTHVRAAAVRPPSPHGLLALLERAALEDALAALVDVARVVGSQYGGRSQSAIDVERPAFEDGGRRRQASAARPSCGVVPAPRGMRRRSPTSVSRRSRSRCASPVRAPQSRRVTAPARLGPRGAPFRRTGRA